MQGTTILSGNRIHLIILIYFAPDGRTEMSIIDAVPYTTPVNYYQAKAKVYAVLGLAINRCIQQNINVAAIISDSESYTNPTRADIELLGIPSISSITHDFTNTLLVVGNLGIIQLNGIQINIQTLKNTFSEHVDADIQVILINLWNGIRSLRKGMSQFRFFSRCQGIDSLSLLLNIQWPAVSQQHLPNLAILIKFIQNLHRVQAIIEQEMTILLEIELRALAIYFGNVPVLNCCLRMSRCLLFFSDTFLMTRVPFIPILISVGSIYNIKEHVRFFKRNDLLPSMTNFMSAFEIMHRDGLVIPHSFSIYFSSHLRIIPTQAFLRDIFLAFNTRAIEINRLVIVNKFRMRLFPSLVNFPLMDINIACALLSQADEHNLITVPHVRHYARLLDILIEIKQQGQLYNFK